jgi:hypothetical protein
MTPRRVIAIKPVATSREALAEEAHERLERAGFMRMMLLSEPRLSQIVNKYEVLGYEVQVLPYDEGDPSVSDGAGNGGARAGGVKSGSGTIYVRKRIQSPAKA